MIDNETRASCESFVGRTRETNGSLDPETARKLAVLLNSQNPSGHLPPTWHWVYFNSAIPLAEIGPDGHERTGRFLPPAPFHRRMWAAGDVTVHRPLRLGVPASRRSEVVSVDFKQGRSGAMCFVTVSHAISQEGSRAIDERQTIVYRDRVLPRIPSHAAGPPVPEGYLTYPDSKLFFYSALTHNGHRIHWDRDHCREVEGYPDLVVHGPLLATELCDSMRRGIAPCRFVFRASAPVFVTTPVRILPGEPGNPRRGQILRLDGITAMEGELTAP